MDPNRYLTVRMLSSHSGAADGITVLWYREGEIHTLPFRLASIFLKEGWAKIHIPEEHREAEPVTRNTEPHTPKAEGEAVTPKAVVIEEPKPEEPKPAPEQKKPASSSKKKQD